MGVCAGIERVGSQRWEVSVQRQSLALANPSSLLVLYIHCCLIQDPLGDKLLGQFREREREREQPTFQRCQHFKGIPAKAILTTTTRPAPIWMCSYISSNLLGVSTCISSWDLKGGR